MMITLLNSPFIQQRRGHISISMIDLIQEGKKYDTRCFDTSPVDHFLFLSLYKSVIKHIYI